MYITRLGCLTIVPKNGAKNLNKISAIAYTDMKVAVCATDKEPSIKVKGISHMKVYSTKKSIDNPTKMFVKIGSVNNLRSNIFTIAFEALLKTDSSAGTFLPLLMWLLSAMIIINVNYFNL